MPTARYTALPNPQHATEDEMEAAFESDDDEREDQATRPMLTRAATTSHARSPSTTTPGGYDFEQVYDYDYPPPGSPPRPSAQALPNDIGNSNGLVPSGPVHRPSDGGNGSGSGGGNLVQRGLRALFPQRYTRLATNPDGPSSARAVGGGLDNDGVFANVVAKPVNPARVFQTADGTHVMPEETVKDAPPSYAAAQADAVPPYWETTVHAPSSTTVGEMVVDGLATGTLFSFLWNMLISLSFNFVGFLLTYLLHTTHAAKYGSRAGLGVTLLQYGFALRNREMGPNTETTSDSWWEMPDPAADPTTSEVTPTVALNTTAAADGPAYSSGGTGVGYPQEWIAFLLMTFGWFLLLTSFLGYWRVKRWEYQILSSSPTPPTDEAVRRDRAVRQSLQQLFGMQISGANRPREAEGVAVAAAEIDLEAGRPDEELSPEERRLRDDLRAAGLI